jgi:hypothetical protein
MSMYVGESCEETYFSTVVWSELETISVWVEFEHSFMNNPLALKCTY